MIRQIINNKKEIIFVILLLVISGILLGYNMFHFPYFENDEGTYMSQAWAIINLKELTPYTYWYDHAPLGWILIALWVKLTGGFYAFGFSVNSGRVLMLILHLFSTLLVYLISKRTTKNITFSIISALLFAASPLGIFYHRRVLLDNIMTFWILVTTYLIFKYKYSLKYLILSAIIFGIAVLTKENAIFLLPPFLYIIARETHSHHKIFATFKWLGVASIIISFYFLYALLKGELFPYGSPLGGTYEHVSLIGTLSYHSSRGGTSILNPEGSNFLFYLPTWVRFDSSIIYLGMIATIFNLIVGIKDKYAFYISLLSIFMWLFLIRGGLVLEFYIIPILPFLALNIGYSLYKIYGLLNRINKPILNKILISFYFLLILIPFGLMINKYDEIYGNLNLYTSDQTTPQIEAVKWLEENTETSRGNNTVSIIDNYAFIELNDPDFKQNSNFEWYWKVDADPEIREGLLGNSPQKIDYIALTPQMNSDISTGLPILGEALNNSQPVKEFWNDGWGVEIWITKYPKSILQRSWTAYKTHYIENGRVKDPYDNNNTTSEGQGYALLRAVWLNDKKSFDEIYKWTKDNMMLSSNLFGWKYETNGQLIQTTATDSDQDIALALLFAYKRWNDEYYLTEAQKILNGIWENEVVQVDGQYYLIAGNWANHEESLTLNPSYFSPFAYRIFAEADKGHDWLNVADTSYQMLNACTDAKLGKSIGVLPPEWCSLNKETLLVSQTREPQPIGTEYSYNAFRIPWKIAIDYKWFQNTEARNYLEKLKHIENEWDKNNEIKVAYQHDGTEWENYESVAAYSGNLGYFIVLAPDKAKEIYYNKILNKYYLDEKNAYWEDEKNYYTNNWAWFATALYNNLLPNLWRQN